MSAPLLPPEISSRIAAIYKEIEEQYDVVAQELGFSCTGCTDNCCDSYFLHHTYSEWAYLWQGLAELAPEKRQEFERRARDYVARSREALAHGERPQIMCPLNDAGLCGLYRHRLLICRLHGVPSAMTRPDGRQLLFPGCFRCQEITGDRQDVVRMERTPLFQEFVRIETAWLGQKRKVLPKVKMTIAEMIIQGPPHFSHCR
ncbi:MAG: hypothetical protein C0613_05490 [Desulfobulbaceae bacterium]|nr:MAG: hypothetical protein C0613_05490 [Desulfobulbaceae bacterium]